jgi:hypothetical protein
MLILGEMDDRALGSLVGTIVIIGAVAVFVGQALWRSVAPQKKVAPPALPPRRAN